MIPQEKRDLCYHDQRDLMYSLIKIHFILAESQSETGQRVNQSEGKWEVEQLMC